MVSGIASVIRRSSRSSSRSFVSALFRSSMSVSLPNPTFPLLLSQAGVLVPALVQEFLGSIREARPQERRNRVDDGLESGRFLAELFESIAQFVVFRILGLLTHDRSVNRDVQDNVSSFKDGRLHAEFSANAEITA